MLVDFLKSCKKSRVEGLKKEYQVICMLYDGCFHVFFTTQMALSAIKERGEAMDFIGRAQSILGLMSHQLLDKAEVLGTFGTYSSYRFAL